MYRCCWFNLYQLFSLHLFCRYQVSYRLNYSSYYEWTVAGTSRRQTTKLKLVIASFRYILWTLSIWWRFCFSFSFPQFLRFHLCFHWSADRLTHLMDSLRIIHCPVINQAIIIIFHLDHNITHSLLFHKTLFPYSFQTH